MIAKNTNEIEEEKEPNNMLKNSFTPSPMYNLRRVSTSY